MKNLEFVYPTDLKRWINPAFVETANNKKKILLNEVYTLGHYFLNNIKTWSDFENLKLLKYSVAKKRKLDSTWTADAHVGSILFPDTGKVDTSFLQSTEQERRVDLI